MRFVCFLFLVVFAGAVGLFAWQNQQDVTLSFFSLGSVTTNVATILGIAYALGMLSGWTVVGMLRRSVNSVMAGVERQQQAGSW